MKDNEEMVTTTETVETVEENSNASIESKTNWRKEHREELNKIIANERNAERQKVIDEFKAKEIEADKLAKMDEIQKKDYEIRQANAERDTANAKLNAFMLKDEAIKQASDKGIDLELMQELDYTKETAESINKKIEAYEKVLQRTREKAISEYSKEPTPKVGDKINDTLTLEKCKTYEDFDKFYSQNAKN